MTTTLTDYEMKAQDFLDKTGVTFTAERTPENHHPGWDDDKHIHGDEYKITFKRGRVSASLKFWNSLYDKQNGQAPTAYDVLACISHDMYAHDMKFHEFCSDYGYDNDSMKAKQTYRAIVRQAIRLRRIWSDSREIELLQRIQ